MPIKNSTSPLLTFAPVNKISISAKYISCRFRASDSDFKIATFKVESIISVPEKLIDFFSGLVGKNITAVGDIKDDMLKSSTILNISGLWVDSKYGEQLKITSIAPDIPCTKEGILRYLASGVVKGVGAGTAAKLIEQFGDDTLTVIENEPERLKEIKGINDITAYKIHASWESIINKDSQIISKLCGYGLSVNMAKKAIKKFGVDALSLVKENPYILTEVSGVGFLRADTIASQMGLENDDPDRIKAAIVYILENSTYTEGHCYLPVEKLVDKASELLGISTNKVYERIRDDIKRLTVSNNNAYLREVYDAERVVARRIYSLAYRQGNLKHNSDKIMSGNFLTREQKEAVLSVFKSKMSSIVGLPGTGKTTIIKYILSLFEAHGYKYTLCAPTGKAAKRITEQTGREAKTIHRLLEYKKDGSFVKNENDPIDADFIIVDESSMVDVLLMSKLISAVDNDSTIVVIGDYNQLPSIGPGNVLRDIVDQNLCRVSRLTQIQRQAQDSTIVRFAHSINSGDLSKFPDTDDFMFIEISSPNDIRYKIVELSREYGLKNMQILSPMKKGVIGTVELNKAARGVAVENNDHRFCVGDKVIQRYNNYNKGVFNGEIGFVVEVDMDGEKILAISVLFDDRRIVYEDYEFDELDYAYTLTVHKSQGSEYDCVVMPISTSHYIMLSRNLLYTAITRAKSKLILIGTYEALYIAVKNNKPINRYTSLT